MKMTQILVQTRGFELTEALKQACETTGQKLIKHDQLISRLEFFLESNGHHDDKSFAAKLKIARDGKDLFIEEDRADMYEAIREIGRKAKVSLDKLE